MRSKVNPSLSALAQIPGCSAVLRPEAQDRRERGGQWSLLHAVVRILFRLQDQVEEREQEHL